MTIEERITTLEEQNKLLLATVNDLIKAGHNLNNRIEELTESLSVAFQHITSTTDSLTNAYGMIEDIYNKL